jgi:hypothetical protein
MYTRCPGDFMAVFQNTATENIASQKRLMNMGLVLKFYWSMDVSCFGAHARAGMDVLKWGYVKTLCMKAK